MVGGCVRDALLGKTPYDWDICTNALPRETIACFADFHTVPTGEEHGTVTVIIDQTPMEVTTYRIDGAYTDGRHPDDVAFTRSLQEDLARRDFTVNAMAFHPEKGLVDHYGGQADLSAQRLRCVGEPAVRFAEDALRILRGFRFASQLGFALERETEKSALALLPTLERVAIERIYQELSKLICGTHAHRVLEQYPQVAEAVFPFAEKVSSDTLQALGRLPACQALRFGMIYRDNPKALEGLYALRAPKALAEQASFLAKNGSHLLPDTCGELQKQIYWFGKTAIEQMLIYQTALQILPQNTPVCWNVIQQQGLCCSLKDLAVSGRDLMQIGFPADHTLGEALERLLFSVMEGTIPNQKEALLAYAATIKN